MISNVKFNELANRFDLLLRFLLGNRLVAWQVEGIPPGMTPVATLAAEYGISTKRLRSWRKTRG